MKRILLFIMAITFSLAPFAQKHSAQKKPVRKTAVTAKKKGCYSCQKDEQQKSCGQKDIQTSCANQSRTQGGNL